MNPFLKKFEVKFFSFFCHWYRSVDQPWFGFQTLKKAKKSTEIVHQSIWSDDRNDAFDLDSILESQALFNALSRLWLEFELRSSEMFKFDNLFRKALIRFWRICQKFALKPKLIVLEIISLSLWFLKSIFYSNLVDLRHSGELKGSSCKEELLVQDLERLDSKDFKRVSICRLRTSLEFPGKSLKKTAAINFSKI